MNDRELKEYMEFLPEEMLSEAAKLTAAPASAQASAQAPAASKSSTRRTAGPGFFKRLTGSAAFRYSAAAVLIVASLAAGIILAIKFGQPENRNGKTVISGETGAPDATEDAVPTDVPPITATPSAPADTATPAAPSEAATPTAPADTATPTAPMNTATPTAPTVTATPTVADTPTDKPSNNTFPTPHLPTPTPPSVPDPEREVICGDFDPPVLSEYSGQYICARVKIEDKNRSGFYELIKVGPSFCTVYREEHITYTDSFVSRYRYCDEQGRTRLSLQYRDGELIDYYLTDYSGDTPIRLLSISYDNGSGFWQYSENVWNEAGNKVSELSSRSDGLYRYEEYYQPEGTIIKVSKAFSPYSQNSISSCYAIYYDESGNVIVRKALRRNDDTGEFYEIDYSETSTPGSDAGPEFVAPADAVQYDVVIDTAKAIIYPVYIPDNIKLSSGGNDCKGYFSVRYEQLIPLEDSADPSNKYDGTFYVTQVYLCDAVKTEETITLSARSIYLRLEYTSQKALNDLVFTLNRKYPNPQSEEITGLSALLNGVTYEIGSGTFKSALFTPVAVKELTLNNRSGNWFLTGHSGFNLSQPASSSTYSAIRISYTYDNSGSLSSIISISSTENAENVQESYYENGVIARTVTTYASGMIDESIYGSDGCYVYHRRVEGNKETIRENYKNRDDLLAFVERVTVTNGEYTVNYTEKQYYYKTRPDPDDYALSGTYLAGDVYLYSYTVLNRDDEGWSRTETVYYMSGAIRIIRESGSNTPYAPAEYVRYYDEEGNLIKEEEEYLLPGTP